MISQYLHRFVRFIQTTTKDLYYFLLKASWLHFGAFLIVNYLALNVMFAFVFQLIGGVEGLDQKNFLQAFFFSIQTMSTIGYGAMHPVTLLANLAVTVEVMVGLFVMSLFTGLMFAKFSRPQTKVLFSKHALFKFKNGIPYFVFRIANQREDTISQASVRVSVVKREKGCDAEVSTHVFDLKLESSSIPIFAWNWTIRHRIDEYSPLFGLEEGDIHSEDMTIVVAFTGHDPVVSQTIYRHHIYKPKDLMFGYRFIYKLDSLSTDRYIESEQFDRIEKII